jgi:hypothetical protein
MLSRVIEEPGLAQHAGPLGFDDPLFVGVQLNIIADAPAEGAGGVVDNREIHGVSVALLSTYFVSSEPDEGMVNVQPRALPWQLPRTRRGM